MDGSMIETLKSHKIVPVVAIGDSTKAEGLASALVAGGLPIAEVTLRTPSSLDSLKIIGENPNIFLGAGSLRTPADLSKVVGAGAKFAVSAGFSPAIAAEAARLDVPYFPGVATPTEILAALDAGLTALKFFPAETLGGVAALKAMSAPFPGISFMPTGGINLSNAKSYLENSAVLAVGGSWMVPQKLIDEGNFTEIEKLTREAVETVRS